MIKGSHWKAWHARSASSLTQEGAQRNDGHLDLGDCCFWPRLHFEKLLGQWLPCLVPSTLAHWLETSWLGDTKGSTKYRGAGLGSSRCKRQLKSVACWDKLVLEKSKRPLSLHNRECWRSSQGCHIEQAEALSPTSPSLRTNLLGPCGQLLDRVQRCE